MLVFMCVRACVRACVVSRVDVMVFMCVRACVRACVLSRVDVMSENVFVTVLQCQILLCEIYKIDLRVNMILAPEQASYDVRTHF